MQDRIIIVKAVHRQDRHRRIGQPFGQPLDQRGLARTRRPGDRQNLPAGTRKQPARHGDQRVEIDLLGHQINRYCFALLRRKGRPFDMTSS